MAGIRMMDVRDVCGLLYLGVICSAVCYLMWNQAISEIGAMKANLYVYVVPVVTMIASVIFLDEKITMAGVIGVGLVVGGMLMTALPRRNHDSREGPGKSRPPA
jgi:drug/metabolite transporter (DMT)-like permease